MARLPRVAAAGYPHHVIQRGIDRQPVFRAPADYRRYLECVAQQLALHEVALHAYVLMPNHVHLLLTPGTREALSRFMQGIGRRYVRWFNDAYARSGALWEGRFRCTVIDADRYLLACMRYIELNPVRAGLAATPEHYPWSSHAHHVGLRVDPLINDHALFWALGNTPYERQHAYRALFEADLPAEQIEALRRATNRGRALATGAEAAPPGHPGWQAARPRGRPRKISSDV